MVARRVSSDLALFPMPEGKPKVPDNRSERTGEAIVRRRILVGILYNMGLVRQHRRPCPQGADEKARYPG